MIGIANLRSCCLYLRRFCCSSPHALPACVRQTPRNFQWTVREFDCALSHDIVDLCDREAEMLNRGRSIETLSGLRQRLANLFLQFIETPDFNPEATRFLKVPPVGGDGKRLLSSTM